VSFLRKQDSSLLGPQQSPSSGLAEGQAGLSRQGRGSLLHSAKVLPFFSPGWNAQQAAPSLPNLPCNGTGIKQKGLERHRGRRWRAHCGTVF
jgi:hypothetical protein